MRETIKFCHVSHSMKRIEIPLSHIRDKNKFKSGDSLFPLIQCFKTFHLSHTQKKLLAFPFIIFTFTPIYTMSIAFHIILSQIHLEKNDVI